jgi:flavin-dependent dehydrogenase
MKQLDIVGAGPAGLSAAIAARMCGADVTVYEKRADVGMRFHGDFQGLENWTAELDVLDELDAIGIRHDFEHRAVSELVCFDPAGAAHRVRASRPIFYLIRRGHGSGTLDQALKSQALAAGAEIRFGERLNHLDAGIVAEGPHRADAIAAGYVFETGMADGCFGAISERLAPAGYSYLLVYGGRGTVATCMFSHFHDERRYVDATVAFFQREAGLRWHRAERFGGSGNFHRVQQAAVGNRWYAGETPGFQDALFGFGLRYALISGHLAGVAATSGGDYDAAWGSRLGRFNTTSLFNRWLYTKLSDRGRQAVIRTTLSRGDPRRLLQRVYAPTWWKRLGARAVGSRSLLRELPPDHDCDCTWCRCSHEV